MGSCKTLPIFKMPRVVLSPHSGKLIVCYFSFTTDQCIDVFQRIFGGSQVQKNVDETNRYYGGNKE